MWRRLLAWWRSLADRETILAVGVVRTEAWQRVDERVLQRVSESLPAGRFREQLEMAVSDRRHFREFLDLDRGPWGFFRSEAEAVAYLTAADSLFMTVHTATTGYYQAAGYVVGKYHLAGCYVDIEQLILHDEFLGQGLGAEALRLCAELVRRRGVVALRVLVDEVNLNAQQFLSHLGFRATGYDGDGRRIIFVKGI